MLELPLFKYVILQVLATAKVLYIWCYQRMFTFLSTSLQGAIFLFFAGRAEAIKGNIDEVSLKLHVYVMLFLLCLFFQSYLAVAFVLIGLE